MSSSPPTLTKKGDNLIGGGLLPLLALFLTGPIDLVESDQPLPRDSPIPEVSPLGDSTEDLTDPPLAAAL